MMSFAPSAIRAGCAILAVAAASPVGAAEVDLLPPLLGANQLVAADPHSGAALFGLDPVSYLVDSKPRIGLPEHELIRDGLVWRFAADGNRAAFLRDPEAFLPRVGGYDATLVARGLVVASDPSVYAIRGGRLFLFRSNAGRAAFLHDPAIEAEAERRWPALQGDLVRN